MDETHKFETLDTSYVSLSALIRYLRQRQFNGRLRIVLDQYEADVVLDGSSNPKVRERDYASGREAEGEAAFERLLVRAREPGGLITVYDETDHKSVFQEETERQVVQPEPSAQRVRGDAVETLAQSTSLLPPAGALIAAVERAVQTTGFEFADLFRLARIEVGDDYSFLDPTLGGFEYANGEVRLSSRPSRTVFVGGLSEALRRVVSKTASQSKDERFREMVAVELAVTARRHENGLGEFASRLEQIAGTSIL
jgi:hypothetical protein